MFHEFFVGVSALAVQPKTKTNKWTTLARCNIKLMKANIQLNNNLKQTQITIMIISPSAEFRFKPFPLPMLPGISSNSKANFAFM